MFYIDLKEEMKMAKLNKINPIPEVEENKIEETPVEKPVKVKKLSKKGVVANCALLNVREAASTKSKIKKYLKEGTEVEILGEEDNFFAIEDGFVMKDYIKRV